MADVNIQACITVRDAPNWHVYMRALAACQYADKQEGMKAGLALAPNKYAVHIARNMAVVALPPEATHLFFIDNDIYLQKDAISLLASVDADIVLGCYGQLTQGGRISPYICIRHSNRWVTESWEGVLPDVEYGGAGCMLIRREIFDALEFPWFNWPLELRDGKIKETSDDVDFCKRARAAGFTISAHGNVFCGHQKEIDSASLFVHNWSGPKTLEEQVAANEFGLVGQ